MPRPSGSIVVDRRLPVILAALIVGAVFAGCAGDSDQGQPLQGGSASSGVVTSDPPTPIVTPTPKPTSQRWHFHDYWKGSPTLTLFDGNVTLNATVSDAGTPALSALLLLPNGVIVPAETGSLTVNASWAQTAPGGAVNLTYKPADSNGFFGAGMLANGKPVVVNTTESMCDVPHRQESLWKFNLTAAPDGTPPGLPARDLHVIITATIGRPLFIDPPHVNWWIGSNVLPLVDGAKGDVFTATTAASNLTILTSPAAAGAAPSPASARVPVDDGRIVPEGAKTVIAVLNWSSQAPNQKLSLRYEESNLPSTGPMQLSKDGANSRVFTLDVRAAMTDTTYSNHTTWAFDVVPDGQTPAFQGTFTLVAWVTELSAAESIATLGLG